MTTELESIKITNSGTLFDGKIWEIGAYSGYTREGLREKLNLREETIFVKVPLRSLIERGDSAGIGGIANYGYGH